MSTNKQGKQQKGPATFISVGQSSQSSWYPHMYMNAVRVVRAVGQDFFWVRILTCIIPLLFGAFNRSEKHQSTKQQSHGEIAFKTTNLQLLKHYWFFSPMINLYNPLKPCLKPPARLVIPTLHITTNRWRLHPKRLCRVPGSVWLLQHIGATNHLSSIKSVEQVRHRACWFGRVQRTIFVTDKGLRAYQRTM